MSSGPRSRRWAKSAADAAVALAVVGGLTLVPLLGWQNARLRKRPDTTTAAVGAAVTEALTRVAELSAIEGTRLPDAIVGRVYPEHHGATPGGDGHGLLVVAFMPTVCGRSLRAGLESLQKLVPPGQDGPAMRALVGEQSRSDRESALALREIGLLRFPVTFVPATDLYDAVFRHTGQEFAQEPLYLRLDDEYRVLTVFEGDQRRPELLDLWLKATGS